MPFDPGTLHRELERLPETHRVAFCASCSQRLIPSYERFSRMEEWGNPETLRTALEEVWSLLDRRGQGTERVASLAEQCEAVAPDTERFISLYTSAALDAASAVVETLRCYEDGDAGHGVNAATAARDAVDMYIQMRDKLEAVGNAMEEAIVKDPLMQREMEKQLQDLSALKESKALTPEFLRTLRSSSSYDLLS